MLAVPAPHERPRQVVASGVYLAPGLAGIVRLLHGGAVLVLGDYVLSHAAILSSLTNTTQCVLSFPGLRLPKSGRYGDSASTSRSGTWYSHHLNTSVPPSLSTRKHSENPLARSSRQLSSSLPYLMAMQLLLPALSRCGGSNTTNPNEPSWYGMAVKSMLTSGDTSKALPSHSSHSPSRTSPNTATGHDESNQNDRWPQHGSRTMRPRRSLGTGLAAVDISKTHLLPAVRAFDAARPAAPYIPAAVVHVAERDAHAALAARALERYAHRHLVDMVRDGLLVALLPGGEPFGDALIHGRPPYRRYTGTATHRIRRRGSIRRTASSRRSARAPCRGGSRSAARRYGTAGYRGQPLSASLPPFRTRRGPIQHPILIFSAGRFRSSHEGGFRPHAPRAFASKPPRDFSQLVIIRPIPLAARRADSTYRSRRRAILRARSTGTRKKVASCGLKDACCASEGTRGRTGC